MSDQPAKLQPLAWHLLAEDRIRDAQAAGAFEKLPGFGQPIPGIDEPHDELWWIKDKLKRENLQHLPPALEIRRDVERTRAQIAQLTSEADVREVLVRLNERIRQLSLGASWGPSVDVMPLDIDSEVLAWRQSPAARSA
jgi:hypothetical protein